MVPIAYYLVLSAVLFSIGVAAFLIKRNIITVFLSIELMLNGVNLAFIAFSRQWSQIHHQLQVNGQIFVFFVMVVAAAEADRGKGRRAWPLPPEIIRRVQAGRASVAADPEFEG